VGSLKAFRSALCFALIAATLSASKPQVSADDVNPSCAHGAFYDESAAKCVSYFDDYTKKCGEGDGGGCFNLGSIYSERTSVDYAHIRKDNSVAFQYYLKSCEYGFARGCFYAGFAYAYGVGAQKDDLTAIKYYEKACGGGWSKGCANAAYKYENGEGVPKDIDKALFFYEKNCELGLQLACGKVKALLNDRR
jgi:TPR repeat protein